MVTRAESAAVTRRALLDAAAELLDLGGPDAVTLREVGARAGVSRGAPYRHFADKDSLLTAVAAEGWEALGDAVRALRSDDALSPPQKLSGALRALVAVGRERPHLYQLLFRRGGPRPEPRGEGFERVRRQLCGPPGDPGAAERAAGRFQDEFLAIVTALPGDRDARHRAALLLAGAHGIAGLELSGRLGAERWGTSAGELVDSLVAMALPADAGAKP